MPFGKGSVKEKVRKPEFYGFREDGSSYKSDKPVENACTRAVWWIVRQVRERTLRPDEVCHEVASQPSFVQSMFMATPEAFAQWSTLSCYWNWRIAWVGSPVLSTIKYTGARVPLTPDGDSVFRELCGRAERIHSEPPAAQTPFDISGFLATLSKPKETNAELIHRFAQADMKAQLAKAKAAGWLPE